jgi:ABC-type sugar transport system substrate-binding protein
MSLAKLGVKNLVLVKYGIGVATCDDREKGAVKAAQEKGIKIVYTIIAPDDAKKAMQDVLVSHPETDGLFVLGSTEAYLSPMSSAITAASKLGKVKVASIDFSDAMKGMFANKTLDLIYGGHIVTSTFAALMAINAYQKTPLSPKPYKVLIPYLKLTNSTDAESYYKLVVGSTPPYNADELRKFVKANNPSLTLTLFQKLVSQYSIADIQARHR